MGNYQEEQKNIIDIAGQVFDSRVKIASSDEKVVHYAELEFDKDGGFSIDECFDLRFELESRFGEKRVDVDFNDDGTIRVVVEIDSCSLDADAKQKRMARIAIN